MSLCKSIMCENETLPGLDFCEECRSDSFPEVVKKPMVQLELTLSNQYPKYYKPVGDLKEIDVYAVHSLFQITDPSGCIHHASKKLLLSGVRTGGKSAYDDIREARDTLNRWLQLNPEPSK